ncbi:MAG: N-succinylarginine dihydrolase [Lentisphaeraceae bacterium]|nr:N-succinylarginine dihydrolase [Lentisphaeraceae bacterium]
MSYREVNFDGLVGPNHNYAGLAAGNLASSQNSQCTSYPRQAALQGLDKMKFLHDQGLTQALLPPQQRPDLKALRKLGFSGTNKQIVTQADKTKPHLLAAVYSASSMWTANCATVTPSCDTRDHKLHLTPANLISNFHRSIEASFSHSILKKIFKNIKYFRVHSPLPSSDSFSDEGAANHMRLANKQLDSGIAVFTYGRTTKTSSTEKYIARQNLTASEQIIFSHKLRPECYQLVQQNPKAIDLGVFHNDVISTSNENFLFTHEEAFSKQTNFLKELQKNYQSLTSQELIVKCVSNSELSIEEAIQTYIFNTQIVTLPSGEMLIIAPTECKSSTAASNVINELISNNKYPISHVKYLDLKQSMSNGGGPACLRLRVAMNKEELENIHQGVILTDTLYLKVKQWIHKHYREELKPKDLGDPLLLNEILNALDELSQILMLGNIYPFQK